MAKGKHAASSAGRFPSLNRGLSNIFYIVLGCFCRRMHQRRSRPSASHLPDVQRRTDNMSPACGIMHFWPGGAAACGGASYAAAARAPVEQSS